MSDDVIQRPKGRRNSSIDLGPSTHEEPVKEKKSISFGRKSSEPTDSPAQETGSKRMSLSFGRRKTNEPTAPQDVSFDTRGSEPAAEEPVHSAEPQQTSERRSFSASIDMGQGQQRSMDLGGQSKPRTESTSKIETTVRSGTHGTTDTGAFGTSHQKSGVDVGPSESAAGKPAKNKSVLGGIGAAIPFGRKEEEDRKGTWGNTGYSATDDQAHRNTTYHIPSFAKQTLIVFMVQMKLFSKMRWTYFMLFMAILIPIVVIALGDYMDAIADVTTTSTEYLGLMLSMMPIFLGFFTAVLSGPAIGREFKDRTAYMNVSLPLSRASFYTGKYLAGFVLALGIFVFAYAMAIATTMMRYDVIFGDLILESMGTMIVAIFAYSATAFCIGAFTKRPSTMTPFVLMTFILPALMMALNLEYNLSELMFLPCFLPDASLYLVGSPVVGSVAGFFSLMFYVPLVDISQIATMVAVGIVWGILFFALGLYRTTRREM